MTDGRRKRPPSVVRLAWGLAPAGGFVSVPDEAADAATKLGLSPAERLTVIALVRGWDLRRSDEPVVRVSLDELRRWTGLTKAHQGRIMRDLAEGFDPPLVRVLVEARGRRSRVLSIAPFVAAAKGSGALPRRVSPAGRYEAPQGVPGGTLRTRRVSPAGRSGVPGGTLRAQQDVEEERQEAHDDAVRGLDDGELLALVMKRSDPLHGAARTEWEERRKRPGRKAP